MDIDIVYEDPRWENVGLDRLARRAADGVVAHLSNVPDGAEVAVLACDDPRIAGLNREFRSKGKPTNVLSWPSEDLSPDHAGGVPVPAGDPELGDIAIAFDTCQAEATEQDKAFDHHVIHLMVHALLHLLGYDHIDDKDAALMERLEVEILAKLDISNPYETDSVN